MCVCVNFYFYKNKECLGSKKKNICVGLTWWIFNEVDLGVNRERYRRDNRDRPSRENKASRSFQTAHRIDAQRMTDSQISLDGKSHDRKD